MMNATKCPTADKLRALSQGRLRDEESDVLLAHVNDCRHCQNELETVSDKEDSLIAALREPGELEQFQGESNFQVAMFKALGALARANTDESAEIPDGVPVSIGEYKILRPLGRGGMGSVYLAKHTKLGREVALKVLAQNRIGDCRVTARFESEMQAVGRLSHPNIVAAHDARDVDGTAVLVTEFIDGYDLGELLRRTGSISVADACELTRQTAVALSYISEQGFVHRDVKPSNIMVDRDGHAKLLDLGLARVQFDESTPTEVTRTGQAMGTADYMAPEQVTDSRSVDVRADIYSLGCTLFKLLTGKAPFATQEHATAYGKMTAHVSSPPPSLAEFCPHAPLGLARLIDSMLAKDVTSRPQTAREVSKRLAEFTSGHDLPALVAAADRAEPRTENELSPRSAAPQPAWIFDRRVPFTWLIATTFGGAALGFALGLIVKITYPDGTTVSHQVPEGSSVEIEPEEQQAAAQSVDALRKQDMSPELVPVTIPVEYADGRPAVGAEVILRMEGNEERPVEATSRAGADGLAFNRLLPYGKYEMRISVPDGDSEFWSIELYEIVLDFGGSYTRKFFAPTPGKRSNVKVQNDYAPGVLEGLRFAYQRRKSHEEIWAPEPDATVNEWSKQFPTVGDGITNTALLVQMQLTREVIQPDGENISWEWNRNEEYHSDILLLTDQNETMLLGVGWGCDAAHPQEPDRFFKHLGPFRHDQRVSYCKFHNATKTANPMSLTFASGDLKVAALSIYGKADARVVATLGFKKTGDNIWLSSPLPAESEWVPRIANLSDWNRGEGHSNLAVVSLALEDGEKKEFRVAPVETLSSARDAKASLR